MSYLDTTTITKNSTIQTELSQQILQLLTKKKKDSDRFRLLNTSSAVIMILYKCACSPYFINYINSALADIIILTRFTRHHYQSLYVANLCSCHLTARNFCLCADKETKPSI